jgi:hypothetical protein
MDDDQLSIELNRDDATALVYVLDFLIEQQAGTGYGALLRGLQTAVVDAFDHVRPDPPEGWPRAIPAGTADGADTPRFGGLPRAILLSVSALSGDLYRDVAGQELLAELSRRGFQPPMRALLDLMHQLQDAGYLSCVFLGGRSGVEMIRLEHRGRQEVEGWPVSPGQPSASDLQALVDGLLARSVDPAVPEPERGKARVAATAVKDLGVSVAGQVIFAWLKQAGVA